MSRFAYRHKNKSLVDVEADQNTQVKNEKHCFTNIPYMRLRWRFRSTCDRFSCLILYLLQMLD
jgi:hypothetical protein